MPLPPLFDPSKTKICKCFKYCTGGAWVTPRQLRYYANQVAPSVTRMQAFQSVGITSGSCAPDTTSQQDGLNNYGNNFLDVDILTPGYTRTTQIGKGVLEVGAPVRRTGLWTPVGYFLCFWTYCGPGYGWIGLHKVRNPTAIPVLPVLILICCAER